MASTYNMNADSLYTKNAFAFAIIVFFAAVIYHLVFSADYLYLDEAYQLWNRRSDKNFLLFAAHGRLISAVLFQKVYTFINTISEVRYLRIISLTGWVVSSALLFYFSKKWVSKLGLDTYLPFLLSIFCICSSAVTVYIGWSSSAQVFLAFLFGLLSGHTLFTSLLRQRQSINAMLITIASGIISLFIYQPGFGIFILPFLLLWIAKDIPQKKKMMMIAIVIYLLTYIIYYLFFKYYLRELNIIADTRTELVFQPLKKIVFFFSTPFSQAWSLNLLHNLHSIVSQIFPILLFALWIIFFIKQSSGPRGKPMLIRIGGILVLLFLSYLPSIIAKENFSSYRTMIAMSLCVFSLIILTAMGSIKSGKSRRILTPLIAVLLFVIAYTNFNVRFVHPLSKEFIAISQLPVLKKITATDTVVFIRADSKLFNRLYGIKSYKDEFGIPSTYRDWTPEGLTRQLIEEQQSSAVAAAIPVYQFADRKEFMDSMNNKIQNPVIIDMNTIMK